MISSNVRAYGWRAALIGFLAAYAVLVVLLAFWSPFDGDEGPYLYEARLLAEGRLPVVEFWVGQAPNFYLAYAASLRLFGCTVEGARMFSVLAVIAMCIVTFRMAYSWTGRRWVALSTVALIAFNVFFLRFNVIVKHHCPGNLGLFGSFAALTVGRNHPQRRSNAWVVLAGALYGFGMNARVAVAAAGPALLGWTLWVVWREQKNWRMLWRTSLSFACGTLLGSLFTLYLFVRDPQALWFSTLGYLPYSEGSGFAWKTLFTAIADFYRAHDQNLFLVWLSGLSLTLLVTRAILRRADEDSANTAEDRARGGALLAALVTASLVVVYAVYGIQDQYLNSVTPFLVAMAPFPLLWVSRERSRRLVVVPFLALGLAVYARPGLAFATTTIVDNRHGSNYYFVNAMYRVASEVARLTPPGDTVLSWNALPVFASGRYLPAGMEQGPGAGEIFWRSMPTEDARRYHIATKDDISRLIRDRRLRLIVDDIYAVTPVRVSFPEYRELLKGYNRIGVLYDYTFYANVPVSDLAKGTPFTGTFAEDLCISVARFLGRGSSILGNPAFGCVDAAAAGPRSLATLGAGGD